MKRVTLSLAILLSLGLAACGGGSDSESSSGGDSGGNVYPGHGSEAELITLERNPISFSIQAANNTSLVQTAASNSLSCYQGATSPESCDLRIYQIMVESFIDGDSNHDYNNAYGSSAHKGDLQGIIDAIPYIASTGSNAIWLSPIFHTIAEQGQDSWADKLDGTGYFASDYFSVDPNFGSEEQFQELVTKAHDAGLFVFLDGVFGHHKGNVVASPNGLVPSGAANPVDYPGIDDATIEFYKEVATYWINEYQIDGWRLDQAYQVPTDYWTEIRTAVEAAAEHSDNAYELAGTQRQPMGYMVAEIWKGETDITQEGYGRDSSPALLSAFDFPMRYRIVQTLAGEESGLNNRSAANLAAGFSTHAAYPTHAQPNLMISNHDLVRFGDLIQRSGLANPSDSDYWSRHQAVFSFMAAYSGPLTLYYGDEIGDDVANFFTRIDCSNDDGVGAMAGYCDDHVARSPGKVAGLASVLGEEPFTPSTQQQALKDYVQSVFSLRDSNPALARGERTHIFSNQYLYIDRKDTEDNHVLLILNVKPNPISLSISGSAIGSDGDLRNLLSQDTLSIAGGHYELELAPFEAMLFNIDSPTAEAPAGGVSDDDGSLPDGGLSGSGPLADCNAPDADDIGPIGVDMWIRGSYTGGDGFAATPDSHKFAYKGDNIYQVVVDEAATSSFGFKFAAADWSYEFATPSSTAVTLAEELEMVVASGPGTEASILIPEAGRYVYSFEINASNNGGSMMISKCE